MYKRQHITGINDKNFNIRNFQERAAINAPIQGSASEIMRIAMMRLHKKISAINENNTKILIMIGSGLFLGSIGYLVFLDLIQNFRWQRFSLNSKIVISSTIFLNIIGTVIFFMLESQPGNGVLNGLSSIDSIKHSIFNSLSGRTAGFSSLPFNLINSSTFIWCSTLMFIGGASASTAGGIKVNTFMVIFAFVKSTLSGSQHTSIFGREIPDDQVKRCITIAIVGILVIIFSLIITSNIEKSAESNKILFEICSAFGTVGLSLIHI